MNRAKLKELKILRRIGIALAIYTPIAFVVALFMKEPVTFDTFVWILCGGIFITLFASFEKGYAKRRTLKSFSFYLIILALTPIVFGFGLKHVRSAVKVQRLYNKPGISAYLRHTDPLRQPIVEGDLDDIKCLVEEHGVNVNDIIGTQNMTPLCYAAVRGEREIIGYLITKGAVINTNFCAVRLINMGRVDEIIFLLDAGNKFAVGSKMERGYAETALRAAINTDNPRLVRSVIKAGAPTGDWESERYYKYSGAYDYAKGKGKNLAAKYLENI
ncbi:hypothetical protein Dip518_000247 [Parelusimicrobium proximum]|uniref:hypothetical protein n=1 Tax=Parelusimicrobium proximum TaxID=3228953 RepID=UPI003D169929